MKMGHTPGPWRFIEKSQTIVSNQSHPVTILSDPFHRQCEGGFTGNDGPLIAAAPEMLKMLRQFEQFIDVARDWNFEDVEIDGKMRTTFSLRREVQALIAKAIGKMHDEAD